MPPRDYRIGRRSTATGLAIMRSTPSETRSRRKSSAKRKSPVAVFTGEGNGSLGNVHAPTHALISRQDTGGCEQTRRHAVEMSARSGKKDGGCICGGCVARGKASERIEIAGGKLVVGRVDCLINWYIADTLDDDDADKSHGKVNNVMFIRDVYTIYWLVERK